MRTDFKKKNEESVLQPDRSSGKKSQDAKSQKCESADQYSFEVLDVGHESHRFAHGE